MLRDTKGANCCYTEFIFNNVWILNVSEDYSTIPHFQKALTRFLKVIDPRSNYKYEKTWWGLRRCSEQLK